MCQRKTYTELDFSGGSGPSFVIFKSTLETLWNLWFWKNR